MNSIHLNNLRFFAHHGYHDEEGVVGTDFEISVSISFDAPEKILTLPQTINYVEVYDVIKVIFLKPTRLLETLANDICESIASIDKRIRTINISITKLHPPIGNFIGSVGVSLSKAYPL
jgi:dihydroneopterin aldolase